MDKGLGKAGVAGTGQQGGMGAPPAAGRDPRARAGARPREREVLQLIVDGLTTQAVAVPTTRVTTPTPRSSARAARSWCSW